jgi:CRP-like cAMP-binding protein/tetratricopeptide (TPR) repeat protein
VKRSKRTFLDGEVIFREGDASDAAYVVVSGKVELTKAGDAAATVVGPGEIFGETGILEQGRRTATARARGPVTVKVIERGALVTSAESLPATAPGRIGLWLRRLQASSSGRSATQPRVPLSDLVAQLVNRVRRPSPDRIEVRIAPLAGDGAAPHTARLVAAFTKAKAVRARPLKKPLASKADGNAGDPAAALAAAARAVLTEENADVLIVGEVSSPGVTMTLRLFTRVPDEEDTAGAFGPALPFTLPADFGPELAGLLFALVLAAANPKSEIKAVAVRAALPAAVETALPAMQKPPPDLTSREQASLFFALGTVAARLAVHKGAMDLHQRAALAFRAAADALAHDTGTLEWAFAQRNLGHELLVLAERSNDSDTLKAAADAFRVALGGLTKERFPREWAALQNRLGMTLYRLDFDAGDVELLKAALAAVQSALQIYSRNESPLRWAEVMNNVGQIAQVLGEQLRNPEVLEKAAEACRQAIEVRRKETMPMLWAASQNNLGSALFLLGKMTNSRTTLEAAVAAFNGAREVYMARGAAKLAAVIEKNLARVEPQLVRLGARRPSGKKYWYEVEDEDVSVPPAPPPADKEPG